MRRKEINEKANVCKNVCPLRYKMSNLAPHKCPKWHSFSDYFFSDMVKSTQNCSFPVGKKNNIIHALSGSLGMGEVVSNRMKLEILGCFKASTLWRGWQQRACIFPPGAHKVVTASCLTRPIRALGFTCCLKCCSH